MMIVAVDDEDERRQLCSLSLFRLDVKVTTNGDDAASHSGGRVMVPPMPMPVAPLAIDPPAGSSQNRADIPV